MLFRSARRGFVMTNGHIHNLTTVTCSENPAKAGTIWKNYILSICHTLGACEGAEGARKKIYYACPKNPRKHYVSLQRLSYIRYSESNLILRLMCFAFLHSLCKLLHFESGDSPDFITVANPEAQYLNNKKLFLVYLSKRKTLNINK